MQLKHLFTVPAGQKVTERHLRRVLISSVCSILLCMGCLVSTTWAWFTVSVESTGNVIQIGTPQVVVKVDNAAFESDSQLPVKAEGTYEVHIARANEESDDLQKKCMLFVTLTLQEVTSNQPEGEDQTGTEATARSVTKYVVLKENSYDETVKVQTDVACTLSWSASWFVPDNADAITDNTIILVEESTEETTDSSEESSTPTEESTAATEESTASTEESSEPTGDSGNNGNNPNGEAGNDGENGNGGDTGNGGETDESENDASGENNGNTEAPSDPTTSASESPDTSDENGESNSQLEQTQE